MTVALRPAIEIPPEIYERLTEVHNSNTGHGGLKLCKHRLKEIQKLRLDMHLPQQDKISTRMINEFIRQCPYCQISNRLTIPIKPHPFTCASYNLFEVLHLDHIGQLPKFLIILVDSVHQRSFILIKDQPSIMNLPLSCYDSVELNNLLPQHTQARRMASWNVPIKKYYITYISGHLNNFH
jgi:hypothetical protein